MPSTRSDALLRASSQASEPAFNGIEGGSPAYRRLTLAMLFAGFSTFSLLYGVQPLLPAFAHDFGLSAEAASLAVSAATGPMAVAILFAGLLSDRVGRRGLMAAAQVLASLAALASAVAPTWDTLVAARLLLGVALSGVPAVAMAYVSEEVSAAAVGHAMGLYIAGSALGGMGGRLIVGVATEAVGWRWALGLNAVLGLAMSLAFRTLAPPSRAFRPRRERVADLARGFAGLFRDAALPWLFAEAFLLMGVFVTIYNYAAFRLVAPPYRLGQGAVAAIFLLYVLGSISSAWFGSVAGRRGRRIVFPVPIAILLSGVVLTLAAPLWAFAAGIGVVTVGFFGAHSIASSWVGRRAAERRGQAASLYLFAYYLGSSLIGSAGGIAWTRGGWPGVAGLCGCLAVLSLLGAWRLWRVPPLGAGVPTPPPYGAT